MVFMLHADPPPDVGVGDWNIAGGGDWKLMSSMPVGGRPEVGGRCDGVLPLVLFVGRSGVELLLPPNIEASSCSVRESTTYRVV